MPNKLSNNLSEDRTMIREAQQSDGHALAQIYNYYIEESVVTFEEETITAEEMSRRIGALAETRPWLVVEEDSEVLGYAYASQWHGRCAYRYSVESSVYLDHRAGGKGLGSRLYESLLERLRSEGLHVVIGGIALPNPASVALHEKFGFKKAAHYEEVGFKFGKWIDVGYWQLKL